MEKNFTSTSRSAALHLAKTQGVVATWDAGDGWTGYAAPAGSSGLGMPGRSTSRIRTWVVSPSGVAVV